MRAVAAAGRARLPDIGDVQKRGAFESDVDKGRLHAGQDARDFTQVDIADTSARQGAFDVKFLYRALLHNGDPRLLRGDIDQDFFVHCVSECDAGRPYQGGCFK